MIYKTLLLEKDILENRLLSNNIIEYIKYENIETDFYYKLSKSSVSKCYNLITNSFVHIWVILNSVWINKPHTKTVSVTKKIPSKVLYEHRCYWVDFNKNIISGDITSMMKLKLIY
jgi:hypothetical protein